MKNQANIETFTAGAVIFDPAVLCRFAAAYCPEVGDLFAFFIEESEVGRLAVQAGVVLPMYEIPEAHYLFRLSEKSDDLPIELPGAVIQHNGIPLRIESGVLVVADLYALMDWDPAFFLNFKDQRALGLGNADYLEVSSGLYSMGFTGLVEANGDCTRLVYELSLDSVETLPVLHESACFGEWDFAIKHS
ncbi:hypothetical protein IBA8401_38480 [Pseudomonas syringae]|nr:hypothetical protein [Pseudomonas syringae group genomosp. 3]MCZ0948786.1 hypothetical protein [Pseudomonas syringae pv. tomato]